MTPRLDDLLALIATLEHEVERELNRAREQWRYHMQGRRQGHGHGTSRTELRGNSIINGQGLVRSKPSARPSLAS